MSAPIRVGQVWRENDDRYRIQGASPHRHVRVLGFIDQGDLRSVRIVGIPPYPERETKTAPQRFGAPGKMGFTLVSDVPSEDSAK